MKDTSQQVEKEIKVLIDQFFDNKIEYEILINELEKTSLSQGNKEVYDSLIHAIGHYDDDLDIHREDSEYESMQREQIYSLIDCLFVEDISTLKCKDTITFFKPIPINNIFLNLLKKIFSK